MRNEMNATDGLTSLPGRPRDRRLDEALLAATRELLVRDGYAGLSLTAVASRAGSSTPAIYRRWPSKVHLVHEAAFPAELAEGPPPTGDFRSDVRNLVRTTAALFSDPVVRAAIPGLVVELSQHPDLHLELMSRLWGSRLDELQDLLDRAAEAGLARPGVPAHHLLGVIGGSAILSVLTPSGAALDDTWVEITSTLVLEGITR